MHTVPFFKSLRDGGAFPPDLQANFSSNPSLPSWLTGASGATSIRTSNGTIFDSSGYLTFAPNNMVNYAIPVDANWDNPNVTMNNNTSETTDPLGTNTANKLVEVASTASHYVAPNVASIGHVPVIAGQPYLISAYVKKDPLSTTDSMQIYTTAGAGTMYANWTISTGVKGTGGGTGYIDHYDGVSVGNGWYRVTVRFVPIANTNAALVVVFNNNNPSATRSPNYLGATSASFYLWAVTWEAVTYQTASSAWRPEFATTTAAYYGPRFDYNPANSNVSRGLLIEDARTNVMGNTQALHVSGTAGWAVVGITSRSLNVTGIDNTTAMTTITEDTLSSAHAVYGNTSNRPTSAGETWTISAVLKAGSRRYVTIGASSGANTTMITVDTTNWASFVTAAVGTSTVVDGGVINLGNNFYRVWVSGVVPAGAVIYGVYGSDVSNPSVVNPVYSGTSSTIIAGHLQFEVGRFPSSYMPNMGALGSGAARAADIVQFGGNALTFLQRSSGAVITQFRLVGDRAADPQEIIAQNTVGLLQMDNTRLVETTNGTAVQDLSSGQTATVGTTGRAGVTWDSSSRSISFNSFASVSNAFTKGSNGNTYLGNDNGSSAANAWYESIGVYQRKLPETHLQDKTKVNGAY